MKKNVAATKANLMAAEKSLELSVTGYDLMDRKRNILIREMMSLMDTAKELQEKINGKFASAYSLLMNANISMGISEVSRIAYSTEADGGITVGLKSVMGVEVPVVRNVGENAGLSYGMFDTCSSLDAAVRSFEEAKKYMIMLAEAENTLLRLALAVKKTGKRANALSGIIIPTYKEQIAKISAELEEKEREEFSRMKVIKSQKEV